MNTDFRDLNDHYDRQLEAVAHAEPESDCPNGPDPETGDWPCDPDDRGRCRTCGLEPTH